MNETLNVTKCYLEAKNRKITILILKNGYKMIIY